ncbi:MAG TPA: diguanylate cyclase [Steroidobacteraceae bacterium]|jgi:diguanylate cyclase (GGDEF)-like protein|nr:diguanylate cyclase [Steroidobacteraceae bacterium]
MPEHVVENGVPPEAHVPQSGLLRLRFPKELEAEYRFSRRDTDRRWARMSLLVALSTVLGFAVIDHWVLPGPRIAHSDLVRFALHLPMVLAMLVLTSEKFFDRWYQVSIQIAAPLFGLGTVLMATQASPEQLPLISARLVLAAFFFYFMLTLTLAAALRTNAILMAAYAIVALAGAVAPHVATYQLWTLFCANLIGAAGCYALERANRMAFLDRRRLAHVAMHDGLTGLLNRAALEDQVRRLYQQAARDRTSVSVVLIDIDHFKAFNDRYGHQAGDQCLRAVACAVRRAALRRPLDLVARYGGEELIAVLFGADRAHAESVARAILDSVRELRIPHLGSATRPYVTASVGAATLQPGDDGYSHDLAVQMADRALYAAKEYGRDAWAFFDVHASLPTEPDQLLQTAS